MDKKVNFIIPYFGKFPNYMQLFLNSCGKNSEFNWTIITDNYESYDFPENVRVVNMSFQRLQEKVQSKFDFKIVFQQPYKLCDMKPMYGYLFPEYVEGYDYWGYCDLDMILGDLKGFITDEMLTYDKIFTLGHMSIIKNTPFMNELFFSEIDGKLLYRDVLQSEKSFNFDEDFKEIVNINTICRHYNVKLWEEATIADIYTKSSDFRRVVDVEFEKKSKNFYVWNNGTLFRQIKKNGLWVTEKYMYIHLQKRAMKVDVSTQQEVFKIIPNSFEKLEISVDDIGNKDDLVKCKNFNIHYFKIRYRNLKIKIKNVRNQ